MKPSRGTLFCRPVKTAETFAGSKVILLEDTRERWVGQQAECVAVGPLEVCEDEECERAHVLRDHIDRCHPCEVSAGDWLLVEARMFVEVEENLWSLPQSNVLAILSV